MRQIVFIVEHKRSVGLFDDSLLGESALVEVAVSHVIGNSGVGEYPGLAAVAGVYRRGTEGVGGKVTAHTRGEYVVHLGALTVGGGKSDSVGIGYCPIGDGKLIADRLL